jgi:hypothetical protein
MPLSASSCGPRSEHWHRSGAGGGPGSLGQSGSLVNAVPVVEARYNNWVPDYATQARERFRTALELFETGEAIMRQNLRRRFPNASAEEIERRLIAWLQTRPGAELGDVPAKGHRVSANDTT